MPLDISGLKPVSLTKNATELPRNIRFNMVLLVNNLRVVCTPRNKRTTLVRRRGYIFSFHSSLRTRTLLSTSNQHCIINQQNQTVKTRLFWILTWSTAKARTQPIPRTSICYMLYVLPRLQGAGCLLLWRRLIGVLGYFGVIWLAKCRGEWN